MQLTINVSDLTLRQLLTTAAESGALGYWAHLSNATRDAEGYITRIKLTEHESSEDDAKRINRYLTPEDIGHAIERLANIVAADDGSFPAAASHLSAALGDHDAGTADVLVQVAVFGKVVYG